MPRPDAPRQARSLLAAALLSALMIGGARAQDAAPPPPEQDGGRPVESEQPAAAAEVAAPARPARDYEETLRKTVAARLARQSLLILRATIPPLPVDYALAAAALDEALALMPDDEEILRRRIEALYGAGDRAALDRAMRELSRIAPEDTVVQLAVVTARISALQDSEARLAAYDRLLSAPDSGIATSVLSRLAFDAALLAREMGDERGFAERLAKATTLDSTNKAAAALAASAFLDRVEDPIARVDLLANVVMADPLDPAAHMNLAREYLRYGAVNAATRFLDHAIELRRLGGGRSSESTLVQRYALEWAINGPQSVLDELLQQEKVLRANYDLQVEAAKASGQDVSEIPPYQPNPQMLRVRLAIATAIDNREVAEEAMQTLERFFAERVKEQREALEDDDPSNDQAAAQALSLIIAESLQARLLSGLQLDKAAIAIQALAQGRGEGRIRDEALMRHQGWYAGRSGDYGTAKVQLEPIVEEDLLARLGLAVAAETADDRRTAALEYAKVALAEPASLVGLFARTRLERMLGQPVLPTELAQRLDQHADSIPEWIDRMAESPESFVRLEVSQVSKEIDRLGRMMLRVRVRNVAPIPVGVGENAPIRTSLLLAPRVTLGTQLDTDNLLPEVVSLDRRLRLSPQEQFEAVIWAGQGQTGAIIDNNTEPPASVRWRAIQGFDIDKDGRYVPGPMSLSAESDLATRGALPPLGESVEEYQTALETREGEGLLDVLLLLQSALTRAKGNTSTEAGEIRTGLCNAVAARMESMSQLERAFTLLVMPPAWNMSEASVIDEVAMVDPSPLVTILLATRAGGADDPMLTTAINSPDPHVATIGRLLHERLTTPRSVGGDAEDGADEGEGGGGAADQSGVSGR